jgi:cellulose synthase/poly-beta-1,6-N-acetylglucosamine synthase-like glycosyltransferase
MLRVLIWLGQFLFVFPALYSSFIALWGLKMSADPKETHPTQRIRVIVAAHNEAAVIAGIAEDLASQTYPQELLSARVVADRCTDDTAKVASQFVEVVEREDGTGAKGAAIAWYLDEAPLAADEALLVLDADNRVDADYVERVAASLGGGVQLVQSYLDIANPDGSVLATANALTYWASNRMVQLSRSNIGWSCDLGGTGMAVTKEALDAAGGFTDDLTDDVALNARLNLAGYRAKWLHDVRVFDEKPTDAKSTVTQRSRWVRGKRDTQRQYGWSLIRSAFADRQPALLDLAYRLYNPGRSFIALVVAVLAVLAAIFPQWGLWPWWFLAGVAVLVVLLPIVFLIIDGIPARYIVKYPYVTVLAVLWLPIRVGSRVLTGWTRTDHGDA